ncbi:MAG TPA: hypothetical protein VM012_11570 [Flavitalea sp.]|nr:hypothetical protein [Flavitalea sp.]
MKIGTLYILFLLPLPVFAEHLDTVPHVLYFNDNFEIQQIQTASYYGIIEKLEKKYFKATLFTPQQTKIATLGYTGKELTARNGTAIGFHQNGSTQFIANFNRNTLDGSWVSYYENGAVCDSGSLSKNRPDGTWTSYYENGTPRMIAQFNARKLSQIKEEMRRLYRPGGTVFISGGVPMRTAGGLRGQQAYFRAQYNQLQEATQPPMVTGRNNGLSMKRKLDLNTILNSLNYFPPFDECLIHGLYKSYFPSGKLKDSGFSINGLKAGVWQEYTSDEQLMSRGFYKKGVKRGEWRYYDEGKFVFFRRYNRQGKTKETVMLRQAAN